MRIAVKNLPKKCTEQEIRDFFNKKSAITDVFMLKTSKGEFRRVCFIGFPTEQDAVQAVEYFDSSYFFNHKIQVELAKGDDKAVQEFTETKLRRALYSKTIVIKHIGNEIDEDTIGKHLEKFGKIAKIEIERKEHPIAIVKFKEGEAAEKAIKELKLLAGKRVKVGNFLEKIVDSRKEHYNSLFFNFESIVKRTCENEKVGRKDLLDLNDKDLGARLALLETNLVDQTKKFLEANRIFLSSITGKSDTTVILRNADILGSIDLVKGEFKVKIAPSKCLALLEFKDQKEADRCYREMNMKRLKDQVIYCEFAPVCAIPETMAKPENATSKEKQTNKIIVKNVPFQASEDELKKIFATFSHVSEVRLPKKPDGSHRGFAFIVLDTPKNVDKAIEYFGSSTHLYGRRLVLEKAKL